jgi:hypothetical protein
MLHTERKGLLWNAAAGAEKKKRGRERRSRDDERALTGHVAMNGELLLLARRRSSERAPWEALVPSADLARLCLAYKTLVVAPPR